MEQSTFEKIYEVVKKIPYGTVASYGQVARLAGNPRWARVVGYALHVNPDPDCIPCYRVVTKDGGVSSAFAFGGANEQVKLLEAEGIKFIDGKVDMKHFEWNGAETLEEIEQYGKVNWDKVRIEGSHKESVERT